MSKSALFHADEKNSSENDLLEAIATRLEAIHTF